MSGGDPYEPLWADSLAHQRRPDVIARVVEEPDDDPPPPRDRRPAARRPLVFAALPLGFVLIALLALRTSGSLTLQEVPSYWNDIPMTCDTLRLERDARAWEWFECRALGGGSLPQGTYDGPEARWTSDITRGRARTSRIRISPTGELVGRATY